MPSPLINQALARASRRLPVLRNLPVVRLLALAELAVLAREHFSQLAPHERRRMLELIRQGRGTSRLSDRERAELSALVAKVELREFAGEAARRLSPIPLPGGRRKDKR